MIISQLELGPPVFCFDILALKQTKSLTSCLPFSLSLIFVEKWWYCELDLFGGHKEYEERVTNNKGSVIWEVLCDKICVYKFSRWQVCDYSVNGKKIRVYQFQFWKKGSCYLRKNLPTKYQLTVQMTWQEGKSEGFREILRYDKRNRDAICGLCRSTRCWKPIHIIKNLQQKFLSKTFFLV